MKIATLRKKAREGSLEVEDLLQAAVERQPGLSEELTRLGVKYGWRLQGLLPDGTRIVPLAKWATVASSYACEEFTGLRKLVQERENVPFVLSLVGQIKVNESVSFALELSDQYLGDLSKAENLGFRVAATFNLLLSFKPAAPLTSVQAKNVQNFLFALYPHAKSETHRALVLLALRGVGDEDAIRFVESIPDFIELGKNTKKSVINALRKRVKGNAL